MAISAAPITSYSDTTAHKKVISDLISIIDPVDTPVVAYFGLDGGPGRFEMVNWPSTKVSWLNL